MHDSSHCGGVFFSPTTSLRSFVFFSSYLMLKNNPKFCGHRSCREKRISSMIGRLGNQNLKYVVPRKSPSSPPPPSSSSVFRLWRVPLRDGAAPLDAGRRQRSLAGLLGPEAVGEPLDLHTGRVVAPQQAGVGGGLLGPRPPHLQASALSGGEWVE